MKDYEKYLKAKEAMKIIGITHPTLRKYVREGRIRSIQLSRSHCLYNESDVYGLIGHRTKKEIDKINVTYSRVSTSMQRYQLDAQVSRLFDWCIHKGIDITHQYSDVKSGMNFDRKDFLNLIHEITRNKIGVVVIESKDRLCRFGFDLFEQFAKCFGTRIIVVNDEIQDKSYEQEMTEDLISIIHHFSMKMYSSRRKLNKIKKQLIGESK